MKKIIFIVITVLIFLGNCSFAQPTIEWVQRYSDYATKNKRVVDTKLDKAGNVYIAGYIENNDTSRIFLTLKYNSSGTFQWARTYNCRGGWDLPVGLCVDTLGNVYVTGRSDTASSIGYNFMICYFTIKYSGEGNVLWKKRFVNEDSISAIPRAMCLDDSMNVYITGYCSNFSPNGRTAITKYNKNGEIVWVKYYPTSADRFVDYYSMNYKNSFLYLTGGVSGSDTNTIKLNLNGDLIWKASFMTVGKKVLVDDSNNVYVGGIKKVSDYPLYAISTNKYDLSGALLWSKYWIETNWTNHYGEFRDIAIDKRGNVYVTGWGGQDAPYGYCYVTIKYNPMGDSLWTRIYHHAYHSNDESESLVTDKYGNVYVTGRSDSAFLNYKMTTIKYDTLGNRKWTARYPVEFTFANSEGKFIELDSSGNMYITGEGDGSSNGLDIIVLKYSTTTGIRNITSLIPKENKLFQNYPNPFNNQTKIKFAIPKFSEVRIIVYDILGKERDLILDGIYQPGKYEVNYSPKDLSSGIYFYKMEINGEISNIRKLVLIK